MLLRVLKKRCPEDDRSADDSAIIEAGCMGVNRIVGLAYEYLLGWLRGKGSPEGFPSGGGLGVSPSFKSPPRLGDIGG